MNIVYSYSALNTHELCPRLFEATYIEKDPRCKFRETAASRKGNAQHKILEDCIRQKQPLPAEFYIKPELFSLYQAHGTPEANLAMTHSESPCSFFAKDVWVRGKVDLYIPIPKARAAFMTDWKTGKPGRADPLQAKVYASLAWVVAGLAKTLFAWHYVNYANSDPAPLLVDGKEALVEVSDRAQRIENAHDFPPKRSWKCAYCPLAECEYNRGDAG
jgi:hypothetical protein